MYCVTYLQACEPDALPQWDDVRVVLDDEEDSQGFDRATVIAPTRERLLEYVREGWGDDDADWFRDYVEARIEECQRRVLVTALVAVPDSYLGAAEDIGIAVNSALEVSDDFGFFKDEDWKPRVLNLNAEESPPAEIGKRYALVANARDREHLARYLPDNYEVVGEYVGEPAVVGAKQQFLVAGRDVAGWTLDDYIIPRLASGLIWANEITADHPALEGQVV